MFCWRGPSLFIVQNADGASSTGLAVTPVVPLESDVGSVRRRAGIARFDRLEKRGQMNRPVAARVIDLPPVAVTVDRGRHVHCDHAAVAPPLRVSSHASDV